MNKNTVVYFGTVVATIYVWFFYHDAMALMDATKAVNEALMNSYMLHVDYSTYVCR